MPYGIRAYIVRLSDIEASDKVDINFFLSVSEALAVFDRLLKEGNPPTFLGSEKLLQHGQSHYETTETGFIVQYDLRRYEVTGITKESIKLRATIKVVFEQAERIEPLERVLSRHHRSLFESKPSPLC